MTRAPIQQDDVPVPVEETVQGQGSSDPAVSSPQNRNRRHVRETVLSQDLFHVRQRFAADFPPFTLAESCYER